MAIVRNDYNHYEKLMAKFGRIKMTEGQILY